MGMSFMRSSRGFMMRVSIEMPVKKRRKIGVVRKNRTQFILFDRHSHDLAKMNVS